MANDSVVMFHVFRWWYSHRDTVDGADHHAVDDAFDEVDDDNDETNEWIRNEMSTHV